MRAAARRLGGHETGGDMAVKLKTKTMRTKTMRIKTKSIFAILLCGLGLSAGAAFGAKQPNIVVIWGDDIGRTNISAWSKGMMGYQTPNIGGCFALLAITKRQRPSGPIA